MQTKTKTLIIAASLLMTAVLGCVSSKTNQERLTDYLIADGYTESLSKFNMDREYISSFYPEQAPYSLEYRAETVKYGIPLDIFFMFYDFGKEMVNKYTIVYFEDEAGKRRCFQKENVLMEKGTDFIEFQAEVGDPKSQRVKDPVFHLWH